MTALRNYQTQAVNSLITAWGDGTRSALDEVLASCILVHGVVRKHLADPAHEVISLLRNHSN